jgi:diguanylate cyclase (GGDEF)-like protein
MSLTHSIAGKLFRIIFSVYFAVTALVTAAQLAAEYREAERRFHAELNSLEATFRNGIDDAVWHFNRDGLSKILHGMLQTPVVLGVEVRDRSGVVLATAGTTTPSLTSDDPVGWFAEPISVTFPVVYNDENRQRHHLGSWTAFSNRSLVFERLAYRLSSIIVASSIKALILLTVFLIVVDRVLGRPLKRLRRELTALNTGPEADGGRVSLGLSGHNELTLVEETLNATLDRLGRSNRDLRDLAAAQERMIAERTRELQAANAELAWLSETDPLTGLRNRRKLETALTDEWRRHQRTRRPLSAIMLDVDYFKAFNDAYGHRAGDDCLQRTAEIIASCLRRPGDIAARYGGEEFLILLPETDAQGAAAVAETIRVAVAAAAMPHACSAAAEIVTVSLGAATATFDGLGPDTADSLIDWADRALYAAKGAGRNRACTAD